MQEQVFRCLTPKYDITDSGRDSARSLRGFERDLDLPPVIYTRQPGLHYYPKHRPCARCAKSLHPSPDSSRRDSWVGVVFATQSKAVCLSPSQLVFCHATFSWNNYIIALYFKNASAFFRCSTPNIETCRTKSYMSTGKILHLLRKM